MPPSSDPLSPPPPARGRRVPLRTSGLLSLLALSVASPLAVVTLLGVSAEAGQPGTFGVAPGTSDDGRGLPAVAAPAPAGPGADAQGLQLRRGCHWGQPGRMPYRGTTRQALVAAGLPEEVVAQIEAQRNAGQKSGRVAITRDGIRHTGDGRVFPARGLALTFGMTLCRDASVNFAKGHEEMADLYEARDAQGKPHAVMVPDVCGNVSVLGERGRQGTVAGMSATLARRAQALARLADALDAQAAGGSGGAGGEGAMAGGRAAHAGGSGAGHAGGAVGHDASHDAGEPQLARGQLSADGPHDGTGPVQQPVVLAAVGKVTDVLVPAQAAAGVVRSLGRVTASAGRGLESLSGGAGGSGTATTQGAGGGTAVPEPGSLWLAGLALLAAGLARRR